MCRHTEPTRADLPPALSAAGAARALVRRHGCRHHAAHLLPAAQLVVSELVTNAVRHGEPPVRLEVDCVYGVGVVLRVSDTGDLPVRVGGAAVDREGGRGMLLVDAVATDWGVDRGVDGRAAGKTVCVTMDPAASALPL